MGRTGGRNGKATSAERVQDRRRDRGEQHLVGSIRDLRLAEVVKMDMKVEGGKVTAFRTRVALSFKYEA
jgi:flavin-binding protein dodecin